MPSLLAVFDKPSSVADVAHRLKNRGYGDLEVYSPAAFPELEDIVDARPSRVRAWTLVGGLVGISLAIGVSVFLDRVIGMTSIISPGIVALAFCFSGAVGVFFGYYPARKAAKLNPIDALRYE